MWRILLAPPVGGRNINSPSFLPISSPPSLLSVRLLTPSPRHDPHSPLISPLSPAGEILRSHVEGNRVLIVTNDLLAPMYLERYEAMFREGGNLRVDSVVLPDGESNKTMDVMMTILDRALELGLDRKVTFVALGGGVIGDMVGFAASIYQRGVNFIQVRFFFPVFSSPLVLSFFASAATRVAAVLGGMAPPPRSDSK